MRGFKGVFAIGVLGYAVLIKCANDDKTVATEIALMGGEEQEALVSKPVEEVVAEIDNDVSFEDEGPMTEVGEVVETDELDMEMCFNPIVSLSALEIIQEMDEELAWDVSSSDDVYSSDSSEYSDLLENDKDESEDNNTKILVLPNQNIEKQPEMDLSLCTKPVEVSV
ncbi:hypothetical protein NEHOM01_1547 [Nematocida homosporus]|uniref:uncharacterized protein n=1 Tax=Nematocida homosporus TaxID=1912981 RepID=UPI00221E3801|nr:uncharacterized protein NEHOM01_1547 [Nematocida homosporus]KAI5186561.1 hypothetical protein NEHOM01_1547 [Nematocida homosporus]